MKRSKQSRKRNRQIGYSTVNAMPLDMETIARINSRILADKRAYRESGELKDWQREIMERNGN